MTSGNEKSTFNQHTLVNNVSGMAHFERNHSEQTIAQPAGPVSVVVESPIPGYHLKPEIAQGGMGIVYSAECLTFGREVAVKVMKAGMSAAVFNREAQITARLPHPGIPPVHALGTLPDGRPYLVMKLIKGETLDSILKNRSDFSSDRGKLVAVFEHICQAVGFAHAQGIIHRDLKPSNVMVGAFGEVQVMDWGLAREVSGAEEIEPEAVVTDQSLTMAGQVKGTPAYMAPEQACGKLLDARADVFALGGILAAILTGRPPFSGDTAMETIARAVKCDLGETLNRLDASGADPELLALCRRCLEARREDRAADGTELAAAVAAYRAEVEFRLIETERERAAEVERLKRRRTQWALAATAVLLMVAGLFGIVVVSLWRASEDGRAEAVIQREAAYSAKNEALEAQAAAVEARKQVEVERERLAAFNYGRTIQVAHQDWRDNNLVSMRALLDGAKTELRGWEWNYLNRLYDPSLLTLKGYVGIASTVAFSPDGTRIITGASDRTAKMWDAQTGVEILTFKGHTNVVSAVSFSPDGNRIVTGSWDHTAKVWDVKTGAEILTFKGHTNVVSAASFSPDGNRIVTGSWDNTAKVWDLKTGSESLSFKGHKDFLNAASFSPDGSRIVTASSDHTAKVWDSKTGTVIQNINGHTGRVYATSFSFDGKRILTGADDMTAKVWDAKTGSLLKIMGHKGVVLAASFSSDGSRIVTGGTDKMAKVWDAKTGAELLNFKGIKYFRAVSFSPDGRRIVTCSDEGTAKVWNAQTVAEILVLRGHTLGVSSASFSPDGNRIVTGSADKTAKVWDAHTGAEVLNLKGHKNHVVAASFSPDGSRIVTGSWDQSAKVWDAHTGAEVLTLKGHKNYVVAASFSADGKHIVTGSWDKTAKVWDVRTGGEVLTLNGHTEAVAAASFSPDGGRIITGSWDWTAKLWDLRTGAEVLTLKGLQSGAMTAASFSNDGSRILTSSLSWNANVWNAKAGAVPQRK